MLGGEKGTPVGTSLRRGDRGCDSAVFPFPEMRSGEGCKLFGGEVDFSNADEGFLPMVQVGAGYFAIVGDVGKVKARYGGRGAKRFRCGCFMRIHRSEVGAGTQCRAHVGLSCR